MTEMTILVLTEPEVYRGVMFLAWAAYVIFIASRVLKYENKDNDHA